MEKSDLFDQYLVDYQDDLKKIIGKHRFSNHLLSPDELLSEINAYLLKKKENIINYKDPEKGITKFTETGFRKAAYAYACNLIKWEHIREAKKPYVDRRQNNIHYTEEGEKNTFELICETLGVDAVQLDFDSSAKADYVFKLLTDYNTFLTDNEIEVFNLLYQGKNQYVIASELGVTHQAISLTVIRMIEKIKHYINFDYSRDENPEETRKGRAAIKSLFSPNPDVTVFTPEDSKDLVKFVKANYKRYSLTELQKAFKNGKFTKRQLMGALNFKKLSSYIRRKARTRPPSYSAQESNRIIKLVKEGKNIYQIAKSLKRNPRQIAAKCTSLVKTNAMPYYPHSSNGKNKSKNAKPSS